MKEKRCGVFLLFFKPSWSTFVITVFSNTGGVLLFPLFFQKKKVFSDRG
jgi:hypothetical protein